ncbi:phosphotransferase enzyme family protein [Ktedonospora formicarum]|uniref:Aminoglycoside phosphotransferase domain-containing protein n=1 Tax=Ktedonospora formicarum TaxID=2778364 RepID=A0A8J3HWY4_9CHLR|nr:phosphotransferase [Ktedonospora formicarum]GHO42540.1 hypothetical protein KSX_07030 [Ktedonospora formicarum]
MNEYHNDQTLPEDLLDLNTIMRSFGIHTWTNLGPAEFSNATSLSLLVEVEGKRYILRERPESPMGNDNGHRDSFHAYLRQQGIPLPAHLQTAQSEPYVTIGEDSFELQEWPEGELFSTLNPRSTTWGQAAATMLGRLHQASSRYQGPQYRWPEEAHIGAMVQNWLHLARGRAETCGNQAIALALTNWAEQWEAVLPPAMVAIGGAGESLPEFHIHGDYHALNLRFGPAGVTAIMGLEASRWEKRIFEVAYALFYFCALSWHPGEPLTPPLVKRGFEPERARQFLAAYGEVFPPVKGEAALLADALMIIAPIATINGPLEDLFFGSEDLNDIQIENLMERLNWASSLPSWLKRIRPSLQEMWA